MSNLYPPRDPLKVWTYTSGVIRIGDNEIEPRLGGDYVLVTLTVDQARDLLHRLAHELGASIFRDRPVVYDDDGEDPEPIV